MNRWSIIDTWLVVSLSQQIGLLVSHGLAQKLVPDVWLWMEVDLLSAWSFVWLLCDQFWLERTLLGFLQFLDLSFEVKFLFFDAITLHHHLNPLLLGDDWGT